MVNRPTKRKKERFSRGKRRKVTLLKEKKKDPVGVRKEKPPY